MQIAPPGGLRAGGAIRFRSLESSSDPSRRSRRPRATCVVFSVIVAADLLAFRLDPQTAHRDATGIELRDRARARLAQASRAEISEWEIDGRFHTSPFNESIYMVHVRSAALSRATLSGDLPDPAIPPRVTRKNESRASMLSLAVRCTVEVAHPRNARRAVNIGTRLPGRARYHRPLRLSSTLSTTQSRRPSGHPIISRSRVSGPPGSESKPPPCQTCSPREARWPCPSASTSSSRSSASGFPR